MGKIINLIGQRFGRLTVIEKFETDNSIRKTNGVLWRCLCECGNEKIVASGSLKRGNVKSCGCLFEENKFKIGKFAYNKSDLIGNRFGRLVVIDEVGIYVDGSIIWNCKCDCGKENVFVCTSYLTSGHTKSCGCLQREKTSNALLNNLIGLKFGKLTVIKRGENYCFPNGSEQVQWLCKCDCGNEKLFLASYLLTDKSTSCGCVYKIQKKYGEASFNSVFSGYKRSAIKRNIPFELDKETFLDISQQNCYYCKEYPNNVTKTGFKNGEFIYNGIDRVNNSLGYIIGNVVSCCEACNRAKLQMSEQEFYNWIQKVYNNLIETNRISLRR